jgi:3'-phosphoadenosine 5'-phosphosulfate sulfotransferase (PAPS reductase)/FAD synthetase
VEQSQRGRAVRGDPFKIEGPALISFSGGRTSAYMLWRILQAQGGALPDDVLVTFANTGKEMPQTLDFVRECGERWGVEVVWLEYRRKNDSHTYEVVTYETASRGGEPFKALIDSRQFLPNPVARFCTVELKIRTMARYAMRGLGWEEFDKVVGLRADEPRRVSRMRGRADSSRETGERDVHMPLATAGITKADVASFWDAQNWGLELPSRNGVTYLGNCDLCFLKSAKTITAIIKANPELARWWIEAEAEARASKPSGARFRQDRPSYAELAESATSTAQGRLFPDDRDELVDCFCGEAA